MRPTHAIVDLAALRRNLARAAACAPGANNIAVIKANGYGHGLVPVARALEDVAEALAVATIDEALVLRDAGIAAPLLVLQGATTRDDVAEAAERRLWLMLHSVAQVEALCRSRAERPVTAWLKIDTGMHRLGVAPQEVAPACAALAAAPGVAGPVVLCTHLACADETTSPMTNRQLAVFEACTGDSGLPRSIANSAGILYWPASHADWNRPGIMLYGCDPSGAPDGGPAGLEAVMRVTSEIIAIRDVRPGEGVGYGQRWQATEPARIGTVSVGYGDGYPRHAPDGTPVWIKGRRVPLAGTVSMDMITVDLSGHDDIRVGDEVELWGPNVAVNEVAARAGTIGYELLAGMTARLTRVYLDQNREDRCQSQS
jgi:alanine racemase